MERRAARGQRVRQGDGDAAEFEAGQGGGGGGVDGAGGGGGGVAAPLHQRRRRQPPLQDQRLQIGRVEARPETAKVVVLEHRPLSGRLLHRRLQPKNQKFNYLFF